MTVRAGRRSGSRKGWIAARLALVLAMVGSVMVVAPQSARAATPPVANPDVVEIGPGQSLDIDVLANDTDDDGAEFLTVTRIVTPPSIGTAEVIENVGVKYISPDPFTGTSFTYEIDDGKDGTAIGQVTVNAAPVPCPDIDVPAGAGGQALRDSILSANTCAGAQTITVGPGTYDRSLPQISDSLTIRAADPGARPVLIDTSRQPSSIQPVVSMTNAGDVTLQNLIIRDAGYYPSLVDAGDTNLTVLGSSLEGSSLPETTGAAGVNAYRGSTVTIRDTVIDQADGAGVRVDAGSLTLDRVSIGRSSATGVQVSNASLLSVTASDIFDNSQDATNQSGINVRATSSVTITDTAIWGNPGFGIDAIGPITVIRGRIGVTPAGVAAGNGTGLLAWPSATAVVVDGTLIAHNQRGILKQVAGPLSLTGATVRDNAGPGLETQGGVTTATNAVFTDNSPDCLIAQGLVVDGGGSTDSDGTCGFSTPNGAPTAVQDRIEMDEDGTFVAPAIGVLGNDSDPNGDPLTALLETDVSHGTLTFEADGGFTYVPFADYHGSDSFTYRANDGELSSEPAVVDITVTGYNDAPTIAVPASLETSRDTAVEFTMSVGDVDADDRPPFVPDDVVPLVGLGVDSGTITVTEAPGATITGNGSALVAIEGELAVINAALAAVTYTPAAGYVGSASLLLAARDNGENGIGGGLITESTVPITVLLPDLPTITIDPTDLVFDEDTAGDVIVTIDDPDGDPSDVVVTGELLDPTLAGVAVTGTGATRTVTLTGTPDANGTTTLQIGYRVESDAALDFVPVTITPINDAPTIAAIDDVTTPQDTATSVPIVIDDVDDPIGALVVTATTEPAGIATISVNDQDPGLDITPVPGASGVTTVEVVASDGETTATTTFELTVHAANVAPEGVDDAFAIDEDDTLAVTNPVDGLLANDTDANGDALVAGTYSTAESGTVSGSADGTFTYVPDPDFFGTDSFTYVVADGDLSSQPVTVTITVTPVNDPPVGVDDEYTAEAGTATVLDVLANDIDVDGDSLLFAALTSPANGVVGFDDNGDLTYTADAAFAGTDSFTYVVSDGAGGMSGEVTVTIVVSSANQPPTASLSVSPAGGVVPLIATANASGSTDTDGTIAGYLWDDDTVPSGESSQTYVFAQPGTYDITLRVVDDEGAVSAPVTRSVTATEVSVDDAVVEFVLVFDPLVDGDGVWSQPSDAVVELQDLPGAAPVVVDIDALSPGSCPPTGSDVFTCEVTAPVPASPEGGDGYRITYPALGEEWLLTTAQDCARPPGHTGYGWFTVPASSILTCHITATEFTDPVPVDGALVELRQSWVTGDGFTDGQAEVTVDGEVVVFPNEDCGGLEAGGGGIRDAGCDVVVAVQPASSTLVIEAAPGWIPSLAGDCVGPASAAAFDLAVGTAGTCDITYTWVGGGSADDAVVEFVLVFDPLVDGDGVWSQPSDAVVELQDLPGAAPVVVDIDALSPGSCPPTGSDVFTCEVTAPVPASPEGGDGYRITYPALGEEWLLTTAQDCARPPGHTGYGWFTVPASSILTCHITATEFTDPVPQGASIVNFEYRWIVDGVPTGNPAFTPSVLVGTDDVSDAFTHCEDLSPQSPGACTATVPTSAATILLEEPLSGTWVFSFGADCVGGSDQPVPPDLVAAQIAGFAPGAVYRCTIDATEIPDQVPDLTASLTANPTRGEAPLTVTLDASDSEPSGNITTYQFVMVAEAFADDGSLVVVDTITIDQPGPVLVAELPDLGTPTLWRARVTVDDDLGREATSAEVEIRVGLNGAPMFTIDDVTVDEGSGPLLLDASGATDPEGDPVSYAWDLDGDGTTDSTEPTATFTATDNEAVTTVEVEVCDDLGACTSETVQVTVENVAPTVGIEDAPVIAADGTVSFTVSITDPGPLDAHSAVIDWGDGVIDTLASVASGDGLAHTYAAYVIAGTVTVTVEDDADPPGVGVASLDLTLSQTIEINTNEDARDTSPGDGLCWIGSFLANGDPACSLRAAVEEANAIPGQQDLSVPADIYVLASELYVTDDLALTGDGEPRTHIDGLLWTAPDTSGVVFELAALTIKTPATDRNSIGRPALTVTSAGVSNVNSYVQSAEISNTRMESVTLVALDETSATVTGSEFADSSFRANAFGSSLLVSGSTLKSSDVSGRSFTLTDSASSGGRLGGSSLAVLRSDLTDTAVAPSGDVLIEDSRVQHPAGGLGALRATIRRSWVTGSGALTGSGLTWLVEASTVSALAGEKIAIGGPNADVELVNATLVGDVERGHSLRVSHSTVVGEILESPGAGPLNIAVVGSYVESCRSLPGLTSVTASLDSDGSCVGDETLGVDPFLGPLTDNGGPTPTHAPLFGSPLLDAAGGVDCPATDQRGEPRPFDATGDGAAVCDIGAVEAQDVIGVGGITFADVDIVERDPGDPEHRPIEITLDRSEPLDVVVRVTAVPPPMPTTELLDIDNNCDPGADIATYDSFNHTLDDGATVLPIVICADEQPEGVGSFEVEIFAEPTQELLASAIFSLSDDDLVLIKGPTELLEGGVQLNDSPFPIDLLSLSFSPERTTYDYTYTLAPNAPEGSFRVRGSGLDPVCTDIAAFAGDVELGIWANGSGTLTTCGDHIPEPDQSFVIEYVDSSGVIIESFPATLLDDDSFLAMSASPVEIDEPPVGADARVVGVPLQLDEPATRGGQVFVYLEPALGGATLGLPGGSCDADIEYLADLVEVQAGATEFVVPVEVCADGLLDLDGPIALVAVMPGSPLAELVRVPITIIDANDSIPRVSVADAVILEGDTGEVVAEVDITAVGGAAPFAVTWNALALPSGVPGRPASSPSDFTGSTGNVIGFSPGGGTETILIPVHGDTVAEGDELFRVTVSASGAQVIDDTANVRIIDDDALRVSVVDAADVVEGDTGTVEMVFTIELDSEPSGPVQVFWETNGIGGVPQPDDPDMATGFGPTRDFENASGSLTFGRLGSSSQQVVVQVRGDDLDEFTENVHLLLRAVSGAGDPVIGDGAGVGRIIDDDDDDPPARPDTEPPAFVGIANLNATIPEGQSAVKVSWNIRASDAKDGVVPHSCSPEPKTFFALGETTVTCGAVDAAGNEASAAFVVTVRTDGDQRLTDLAGDSADTIQRGSQVNVQASGFLPASQVRAELRSDPVQLALLHASQDGKVNAMLSVPDDAELGEHTIALQGVSPDGQMLNALFTVEIVDDPPECTIVGTPGDDNLRGTPGPDVICGLGGDDLLRGLRGDDVLIGGSGNDRLVGGDGNDVLWGKRGDDVLIGGKGDDLLRGGNGDDRLIGGRGADALHGGKGDDVLRGGNGDDVLRGGKGDDVLWGENGDDVLRGGDGNDILRGGSGDDVLHDEDKEPGIRGG